ncbi:hypothetical protein OCAE111667_19485 [Occultella aeris]|uniref:RiboL-PSP-HEPN domain-containing protein n=1 Tax=Occultella aeris TaxID=2761496 RepID=A0A7M4DQA2_9MICO|nr:hypothetical protein [Occultella aeris]VZO39646.1 hypothetical protein HALOF300_04340 [Occultella aeris]
MAAPRTPREVADWAASAQADLSKLLAKREVSSHRVLTLTESFEKLTKLSLKQDKMFREALQCAEQGFYRSAHVAAWAAVIDFCHEWAADPSRLAKIQAARTKWVLKGPADFRSYVDFQLFEALEAAGLMTKTVMKAFQGLLNKRNECAHPEDYDPTINDTLGYLDELMKRVAALQAKSP